LRPTRNMGILVPSFESYAVEAHRANECDSDIFVFGVQGGAIGLLIQMSYRHPDGIRKDLVTVGCPHAPRV